jgi:hypothetical protein
MRGPTAAWRVMAQADLIRQRWRSLSDLDCSLQMTRRAMKRAPVTAGSAHGQAEHVASGDEIPERRSCGSD